MGIFKVEYEGKCGIVDDTGKIIVPCIYSVINIPRNGYISVRDFNYKWGAIDESGNIIVPCKYDDIGCFNEGMACVEHNGKIGFVNTDGKLVIPCIYNCSSMCFNDGLVDVELNGKTGYIDKTGNIVVPFIYDEGDGFFNGLALVERHGKSFYNKFDSCVKPRAIGYIDTKGNEIIPCDYYPESFDECYSVEAVKQYSNMKAVLETYRANYKIDHAKTEDEAQYIIDEYAEIMESIVTNRNIRLSQLNYKEGLSVQMDKLAQETNKKIQDVVTYYREAYEKDE